MPGFAHHHPWQLSGGGGALLLVRSKLHVLEDSQAGNLLRTSELKDGRHRDLDGCIGSNSDVKAPDFLVVEPRDVLKLTFGKRCFLGGTKPRG